MFIFFVFVGGNLEGLLLIAPREIKEIGKFYFMENDYILYYAYVWHHGGYLRITFFKSYAM
jgi:hypothetical protein